MTVGKGMHVYSDEYLHNDQTFDEHYWSDPVRSFALLLQKDQNDFSKNMCGWLCNPSRVVARGIVGLQVMVDELNCRYCNRSVDRRVKFNALSISEEQDQLDTLSFAGGSD
jgi:hypothetical protein